MVDNLLERFKEHGIDVSNLFIESENDKITMYRSIQVYIEEIMREDIFEFEFGKNMTINDGLFQRVVTFSFSSDLGTMHADINEEYPDKKMQNSVLSCYFLMIKDLNNGLQSLRNKGVF